MSKASDFETMAKSTEGIHELIGQSGRSYIFFFFPDHSVTAARKVSSERRGMRLDFAKVNVKEALRDCEAKDDGENTTYQLGHKLLNELGTD